MLALPLLLTLAVAPERMPPPLLDRLLDGTADRRYDRVEKLAELKALAGLLQRLNLTPDEIAAELPDEAPTYMADLTDAASRGVDVGPFYATRTKLRLRIAPRAKEQDFAADIEWEDRLKGAHRIEFVVDPLRRRAGFVNGPKLPLDSPFRILLPHRVSVAVEYGPRKAFVRVYNGVASREFTLSQGQPTVADTAPPPNDGRYGEQLAVLALTDDTLRFVLPNDVLDPSSARNDEDRHFLRTFRTWQHRADGTRDDAHRELLKLFRAFDTADAETKSAAPAAEAELVARRRELLVQLRRASRPLQAQLRNLHLEQLAAQLREAALARRLRAARQSEWLAEAEPLFAGPAVRAAVATAPAPRPLGSSRPIPHVSR